MSWERLRTLMLTMLLLAACSTVIAENTSSFDEATYTLSSRPEKLVLYLAFGPDYDGGSKTVKIYSSGKVSLGYRGSWGVQSKGEQQLSTNRLQQIMEQVVTHGLAEWDATEIEVGIAERMPEGTFYARNSGTPALEVLELPRFGGRGIVWLFRLVQEIP
ncbi:MAG: hypothetical protein AAF725_25320 [Acidobacteriota bacterium]